MNGRLDIDVLRSLEQMHRDLLAGQTRMTDEEDLMHEEPRGLKSGAVSADATVAIRELDFRFDDPDSFEDVETFQPRRLDLRVF